MPVRYVASAALVSFEKWTVPSPDLLLCFDYVDYRYIIRLTTVRRTVR